jgi:hypothetical protein
MITQLQLKPINEVGATPPLSFEPLAHGRRERFFILLCNFHNFSGENLLKVPT